MAEKDRSRPAGSFRDVLSQLSSRTIAALSALLQRAEPDDYGWTERQRQLHGERSRAGVARARAEGKQLGRPSGVSDELRERIVEMRRTMTFQAVADELNAAGVKTSQGGAKWYPSTVKSIVERAT